MDEISIYCGLMDEVKRRTMVVYAFLNGQTNTPYMATAIESTTLQVRMILELIALGTLVTHKDEYSQQHDKFAQHWHAERILRDVEKINPYFYPRPIKEVPSERAGVKNDLVNITEGYLTREDLVNAYDTCSKLMHARNPFDEKPDFRHYEEAIPEWMVKIKVLLNSHIIHPLNSDFFYLVHLKEERDDRAHGYVFARVENFEKSNSQSN